MSAGNIEGKVAVVTGSTSGIGLGIATALAGAGAKVLLNGLGEAAAIEATRKELDGLGCGPVLYHPADMTHPDQIADMMAFADSELGGIDILINNAGIQFVSPIEDFPPDKWDAILAINLTSAFHTIRAAVPLMKTAGWGRIVNIASAHALVASPFKAAYVAAKHGLLGLTRTVSLEVAESNITANAICPGYVRTPLVENQIADTAKARGITPDEVVRDVLLAAQPTKKFVEISELSDLTLFLCSDGAASINGAALSVDGGWSAH